MIIGIDVDDVLVPMAVPWLDWLATTYNDVIHDPEEFKTNILNSKSWQLVTLIDKYLENTKILTDKWDYWRNPNLYDDFVPRAGASDVIKFLVDNEGHEILFISHCFPEHYESKLRFLKKYFDSECLISCDRKYKHLLNTNLIIDDCPDIIRNCVENCKTIGVQFMTEFKYVEKVVTDEPLKVWHMNSWYDILLNWNNITYLLYK